MCPNYGLHSSQLMGGTFTSFLSVKRSPLHQINSLVSMIHSFLGGVRHCGITLHNRRCEMARSSRLVHKVPVKWKQAIMRAKCLAQEHKTMTPAGSEPGLNSRYVIQSTGPPRLRFLLQANVCRYVCMHDLWKDKRQIPWRTSRGVNWRNVTKRTN